MAPLVILLICACSASILAKPSKVDDTEDNVRVSSVLEPYIVGGRPIDVPIFYQVSLRTQMNLSSTDSQSLDHYCGGSLIGKNIVLTAAHCFKGRFMEMFESGRIYAVLGTNKRHFLSDAFVTKVDGLIRHPNYDDDSRPNDIAVVKLERNVPSNNIDIMGAIPLRSSNPVPGESCHISGWGTTAFTTTTPPNVLHIANVPIVAYTKCVQSHGNLISPDMVCAGGEKGGADFCLGDSGGPLVCRGELTGIILWGYKCAEPGFPGVYSSVAYHRNWVLDAMKRLGESSGGTPPSTSPPDTPQEPTPKPSSAIRSTNVLSITLVLISVILTLMF